MRKPRIHMKQDYKHMANYIQHKHLTELLRSPVTLFCGVARKFSSPLITDDWDKVTCLQCRRHKEIRERYYKELNRSKEILQAVCGLVKKIY